MLRFDPYQRVAARERILDGRMNEFVDYQTIIKNRF